MPVARSIAAVSAAVATFALSMLAPHAAWAHPGSGPQPIDAKPAPARVITERFDHVEVTFSAPLTASGNTMEVIAPNGRKISTGKATLAGPTTLRTAVKTPTQAGKYTVNFVTTAAGHADRNGYEFTFQPPPEQTSTTATIFAIAGFTVTLALVVALAVALARKRAASPAKPPVRKTARR